MKRALKINPSDTVAVALTPLHIGDTVEVSGETVAVAAEIPAGHKLALRPIARGETVIKYGYYRPLVFTKSKPKFLFVSEFY